MAESLQSIQNKLISQLLTNFPNIDTNDGSMTRDLMVDPQAVQLYNIGLQIDSMGLLSTFVSNASDISNADMDAIGISYGITRKQATKSTGSVVFYVRTQPAEDIIIPEGTTVSTYSDDNASAISFVTTEEVKITESDYNNLTGNYEVIAPIESENTGSVNNIASGLIRVSSFSQVDGVINREPTISGTNTQENIEYATDIRNAITGASRNIDSSIESLIIENNESVSEVKCVHPNTLDNEGNISEYATPAGYAKIYIRGNILKTMAETFSYTVNKNSYVLNNCPVHNIQSVTATVNGELITLENGTDYYLKINTENIYSDTLKSNDSIVFNGYTLPDNNTNFTVNYTYNALVKTVQNLLNEQQKNFFITGTILVAETTAEELYLTLSIKLNYDYTGIEYKDEIRNGILSYIQSLPLEATLTQDNIYNYLMETYPDYINIVRTPFTVFYTDNYKGSAITLPPYKYFNLSSANLNINFE